MFSTNLEDIVFNRHTACHAEELRKQNPDRIRVL